MDKELLATEVAENIISLLPFGCMLGAKEYRHA